MSTKKLTITLPAELRQAILECKAGCLAQVNDARAAESALDEKISEMEAGERKVLARISSLTPLAISSDESAGALANATARLPLVQKALEQLRSERSRKFEPDNSEAISVFYDVLRHWKTELDRLFDEAIVPFHPPANLIQTFKAHSDAFYCLRVLTSHPPIHVTALFAIFDRALRGQVSLATDEPVEPADAAPENESVAAPSVEPDTATESPATPAPAQSH